VKVIFTDIVGWFELPHKRSPLQKVPENPEVLGTKFYLFKRSTNLSHPEILNYDDEGKSLANSSFNYTLPMKMMIENRTSKLRIEPRNCTKSVVVLLRSTFPCCKWFYRWWWW
jgi:hypothetical protein